MLYKKSVIINLYVYSGLMIYPVLIISINMILWYKYPRPYDDPDWRYRRIVKGFFYETWILLLSRCKAQRGHAYTKHDKHRRLVIIRTPISFNITDSGHPFHHISFNWTPFLYYCRTLYLKVKINLSLKGSVIIVSTTVNKL